MAFDVLIPLMTGRLLDEGVSEQLLKDAFRIYALTLGKLMKLQF